MMEIKTQLTKGQQQALDKMIAWWKSERYSNPFVLAGYAGTGKTFLIKEFAKNHLKLDLNYDVAFCTPTGKAATVLIKNGLVNTTTIHRLIYIPEKRLVEIEDEKGELKTVEQVFFVKNEELRNGYVKLIIVDEISMVSEEIFEDLKSFGVPILCSGDPGQLPPVGGNRLELLETPDEILTEIVRQNEGSKIIEIADRIRKGEPIPYGDYGQVKVIEKSKVGKQKMLELCKQADQVLCGKNSTRTAINKMIREHLEYTEILPEKGEKLICVQNNWELFLDSAMNYNLVNGMMGTVEKVVDDGVIGLLNFKPEFLHYETEDIYFDTGIFKDDKYYFDRGTKLGYTPPHMIQEPLINMFEFGYAISVHKSQGSEFEKVLIVDESRVFREDASKWLYTAITRAEKEVVIIR